MKTLHFTDVHCTRSSEFSKPTENGLNEYLELVQKSFEFVREIALQEKPDILVFNGDFWDAQDYIDTVSLNLGFKLWSTLESIPVDNRIALVGNHDYYSIENNIHTLEFLNGQGWEVVDELKLITLPGLGHILGVPYRDSYDLSELSKYNASSIDIVLAHSDVIGGLRRAPKSEGDVRAFSDSGLPRTIFDKVGVVLNGHYHHPSQVSTNWYNIGSLTSRTFHDKHSDPRGVVLYDTETRELKRFDNPHARQFLDIHIEDENDLTELLDEDFSNSYGRIYYEAQLEEEVQAFKEFFAGARLLPKSKKVEATPVSVDLRFSLEENLERYIDEEYADQDLKVLALDIFKRAAEDHAASSSREPLDFGWLVINNFQCIGYAKIDLRRRGLFLLRGSNNDDPDQDDNGSGKTTLVEALYWCLTGKSLRGLTGNDVIHWDEESCSVSLELHSGEQCVTSIRSRKDPEYGTGLTLLVGGHSTGERLSKDTEKTLESLLGRSEKSLRHMSFLTADLAHRFSKLSYPDRARLLEEIIDSRPYSLSKKIAEEMLKSTTEELAYISGAVESSILRKDSHIELAADLEKRITEHDEYNKATRSDLDSQVSVVDRDIAEAADEMKDLHSFISTFEVEEEKLIAKRKLLEDHKVPIWGEMMSTQAQINSCQSEIRRLGGLLNKKLCPTCESPLNSDEVSQKLSDLHVDQNGLTGALHLLREKVNSIDSRVAKVDTELRQREATRRTHRSSIAKLEVKATKLRTHRESLFKKLDELDSIRERLCIQLDEKKEGIRSLEEDILKRSKEEDDLEVQVGLLTKLSKEVFDERGVRNSVLSQVAIPYINARLPEYTQDLWGGQSIELSGSRELKGGKTKNEIDILLGGRTTYKASSSGQRRRIDLALQFTLSDLAAATGRSRIGFLAIDEVLDPLDESGVYAAKEVLARKAENSTILMISHSKYAAAICPSQIVASKVDGYTTLVESTRVTQE